jgi:hypothetical protein
MLGRGSGEGVCWRGSFLDVEAKEVTMKESRLTRPRHVMRLPPKRYGHFHSDPGRLASTVQPHPILISLIDIKMSTPHIPNLLLSGRLPGRGRGLGRGRGRGLRDPSAVGESNGDAAIQRTDMDASGSRLSVVAAGYLEDNFARLFYQGSDIPRRMPIINRGSQPCRRRRLGS